MKKVKAYVISFAVLLAAWQLLAMSGLFPSSLFPSPVQAAQALIRRAASGALILDIGASMYRSLLGYILAVVSAVLLGLLLGWFPKAWNYVNPIVPVGRNRRYSGDRHHLYRGIFPSVADDGNSRGKHRSRVPEDLG